jgi:competence protein ComEC
VRDASSSIWAWPPRGRRVVEANWTALLAAAACAGLSLANWVSIGWAVAALLVLCGLVGVGFLDGNGRVVALGVVLAAIGLWWGSLRLAAQGESVLATEVGSTGTAELVTTGPSRRTASAVRAPADVRAFRGRRLFEHVLVSLPVGRSPPRGAVLEADVRVAEPRPARNGFDERAWLARQGIHVVLRATSWRQVGRRGGIAGVGDRLRDRVEAAVGRGTSGMRRAVVLGVVLGEDEGLTAQTRNDFRASGLYHLLAVSGQNVAFIAGGMLGLGWLLRLSRAARELMTLAAIGSYLLAVGWQPSVIRAGVAGTLASLAWLASRPRDRWHFLALGALVLLTWTPTSLLEPGFQLSFVAVAAIFVGLPRIQLWAEGYPLPRRFAEAIGVALVCGLATAPIVLVQFGRAPVYTVPANALAEPAMPLVLGLGLLAAAVDPIAPGAAASLAWLAGWGAAWLELVARVVASLPSAQVGPVGALALLAAGATAWALFRGRVRRTGSGATPALAAAAILLVAGVGWWSFRPGAQWHGPVGLRVTFLDVGQGDSVLLETPSSRVLVDEGPPEADVADQLSRMGIHSLSAVVLTHPERDHVGGAAAVFRRLRVGVVLDPELAATGPDYEEAMAVVRARHIRVEIARTGAEFRVGGLALRVLNPPDPGLPSQNPNLNAVVLIASYGETDVFLPADAESDVTGHLPLHDVEILKVAHHGSEDPGLEEELRALHPEIAVISVGQGNDYGHPRPGTLAVLASVPGLALYRTDLDGRVVVESDGRALRVRTEG